MYIKLVVLVGGDAYGRVGGGGLGAVVGRAKFAGVKGQQQRTKRAGIRNEMR